MPGSSHEVDPTFMDELPLSVRDPALDMIRYATLKEMLLMRINGPTSYYRERYSLSEEQWTLVLNAVLLTKISYFQITMDFPNAYIDKLLEIAAFAAGLPGQDAAGLYKAMVNDHPMFADWIKRCLIVKQQKARGQKRA
ncbi:hypothetical protein QCB44_00575 [Thiomicrorhabdus sp. zzn3]|uniref:hypothetical protein n=1 Tax=Thiomicrorhabdus sp. zzn3 TaxID=3039775 RepID=UPI0024371E47|nr:hypothetical protein [Thiomicrorhabdus sp. zzn3]MDG6777190.1 hypothetical protein [Thiomicrorhabdus sp. zzn3]